LTPAVKPPNVVSNTTCIPATNPAVEETVIISVAESVASATAVILGLSNNERYVYPPFNAESNEPTLNHHYSKLNMIPIIILQV
jgi:hypothetical protein